jgi:hypothetical protein
VELYFCSAYMPLCCGQGQLFCFKYHRVKLRSSAASNIVLLDLWFAKYLHNIYFVFYALLTEE